MRISTRSSSVNNPSKRRQNYVNKLNNQIEMISQQVKTYNNRQKSLSQRGQPTLKALTQPKFQNFLVDENFNPQVKPIESNTKFYQIFRNNSTVSQVDFTVNQDLMNLGRSQYPLGRSTFVKTDLQMKIVNKLNMIDKQWTKIDKYRQKNDMDDFVEQGLSTNLRTNKKTKNILNKIAQRRPNTGITRTSYIRSQF